MADSNWDKVVKRNERRQRAAIKRVATEVPTIEDEELEQLQMKYGQIKIS